MIAAVTLVMLRRPQKELPQPTPEPLPSPEILAAIPLDEERSVGAGKAFDRLTLFPILAKDQPDLGPFTTLSDALESKTAEVREVGSEGGGERVNALVIENKSDTPIFVLAGTVVKGGRQDRQIAQDFLVGARETVNVEAFCVEQGRWAPEREGALTQGKFGALKTLANSQVRVAGQHKKDQSEVWSKVGEVNAANGKSSPTGTLAASLDDQQLAASRAALAERLGAFLDGLEPQRDVVGMAYAVDGQVRGVRWFANHRLYGLYRTTLLNTAALEAITAREAEPAGATAPPPAATPEAVKAFVEEIEKAPVGEVRPMTGGNVNDYKESSKGYGAKAKMKTRAGTAARAEGAGQSSAKPINISSDFVAK
jgi:hypothetical protein